MASGKSKTCYLSEVWKCDYVAVSGGVGGKTSFKIKKSLLLGSLNSFFFFPNAVNALKHINYSLIYQFTPCKIDVFGTFSESHEKNSEIVAKLSSSWQSNLVKLN